MTQQLGIYLKKVKRSSQKRLMPLSVHSKIIFSNKD